MSSSQVLVVIPVYSPDDRLIDLVSSLSLEAPVLVVDDGSPVTADPVLHQLTQMPSVSVQRFDNNAGIARSLNAGLVAAQAAGAEWMLTVDQDSVPQPGLVEILRASADRATEVGLLVGAVGCGQVRDASGGIHFVTHVVGEPENAVTLTEELIQTGTLWSCDALALIGGFDERIAIDGVDTAASLRLRARGYSLLLAPDAQIDHELGSARAVRILGKTALATGHSPARRETIVRNRLRLLPEEFALSPKAAARSLRRLTVNTALAVTVEEGRWAKAKASIRGLRPRKGK